MLPLTGYADRLSVRPGETIRFHIASATAANVETGIVRVISADPNPDGMGIRVEQVSSAGLAALSTPRQQTTPLGSCAIIPANPVLDALKSFTLLATIKIGDIGEVGAAILSTFDADSNLKAQDRMKQIASRPDLIVPGHDPAVFIKFPKPGNGVARIQ